MCTKQIQITDIAKLFNGTWRIWLVIVVLILCMQDLIYNYQWNVANVALVVGHADWKPCAWPVCVQRAKIDFPERFLGQDSERHQITWAKFNWLVGDCEATLALNAHGNPFILWLQGQALLAQGQFGQAAEIYHNLGADSFPNLCAQKAQKENNNNEMLKWLEFSTYTGLTRWGAQILAAQYLSVGQEQRALQVWRQLVDSTNKEDADHWWAMGQMAEINQKWKLASEAYLRGSELSAKPYQFYIRLGQVYQQMQDYDRAKNAYLEAVNARPDVLDTYLALGHLERNQGDYEAALKWYEQAQALWPNDDSVLFYVGISLYQLGDVSLATEYLEQAFELEPTNAQTAYYLAHCYKNRDLEQAIIFLQQAISWQKSPSWRWLVELGDWFLQTGDIQGALSSYKQALDLAPNNADIEKRITRIELLH